MSVGTWQILFGTSTGPILIGSNKYLNALIESLLISGKSPEFLHRPLHQIQPDANKKPQLYNTKK
jgi:hypothetical protein